MPDITKFIKDEAAVEKDPAGNFAELDDWSEDLARQRAGELNIELQSDHWEVVRFLREFHRQHGQALHARVILEALEERFAERGGSKYLYTLFPGGAVTQGSQIAGLSAPKDSVDPSFGTAM